MCDSTDGGVIPSEASMRGLDERSGSLFSYVDLEARVRADHPLRPIRAIVNSALDRLRILPTQDHRVGAIDRHIA